MEKISPKIERFLEQSIDSIIADNSSPKRKKLQKLSALLNLRPHKEFVIFANGANGGAKITIKKDGQDAPYPYVPIGIVEYLLKVFFVNPQIVVTNVLQAFNAITVTVCIEYECPITGDKMRQYGVGAKQMQLARGSAAFELAQINNAAVEKALPAAKSLAIKDAADHIGNIFGANVARDTTLNLSSSTELYKEWEGFNVTTPAALEMQAKIIKILDSCKTAEEVDSRYNKEIIPLLAANGFKEGACVRLAEERKQKIAEQQPAVLQLSQPLGRADLGEFTEKQLSDAALEKEIKLYNANNE